MKRHNTYSLVQILWLLAALLLFAAGILCTLTPDEHLLRIANPLGLVMLVAGGLNIGIAHRYETTMHGAHWLMAEGLTAAFLSLFPLFNQVIPPAVIPFFFEVWELISGILKVMDSKELHAGAYPKWRWFYGIGCIELVSGISSMLKPIDDLMGVDHVIGAIFFLQGIGFIFKASIFHDLIHTNKKG